MNSVIIIAKREWRALFDSPIAYIFLLVFLVLSLGFFQLELFEDNEASLRHLFENFDWTFFILIPPLAMRQWAEEQKSGTLELLLTWPLKEWEIVVGKFIAAGGLVLVALALTLPAAFMVDSLGGNLDWGPVLAGYLGASLMGLAYLSVSFFLSSFTRSQVAAFLLSLIACVLLWLPGEDFLLGWIHSSTVTVFQELGFGSRFRHFEAGLLKGADIVYYLSWILLGGLLTIYSFKRHRMPPS
jgi:ABC-2 type transport system permease protein